MSLAMVRSAALVGVDALPVDVEVAITKSIPGLKTLGRPDATLREGSERVLLGIKHAHLLDYKPSVIVNLAPADLRKSGPSYELAIAIGILIATKKIPPEQVADMFLVGEMSLRGAVRPVRGVLSIAMLAVELGVKRLVVPQGNAREASLVGPLEVFGVSSLRELADGLRGDRELESYRPRPELVREASGVDVDHDFADVRGQAQARRAAEIAAAGGHNLLMVGPPGSGKTMIARRLPGILPPLGDDEAIATTRVISAAGLLPCDAGLIRARPFRAPHHTISSSGLVGGYAPPRPGEVSLAHNGVLFLDEMAEFSRRSLEALREPVEEGCIRIVRAGVSARFPSEVVLVAATNPCPCGHLGDRLRACGCSPGMIERYRGRLSGPLLDRIDMHIEVPLLPIDELDASATSEGTAAIRKRVLAARARQLRRRRNAGRTNAGLGERAVRELIQLPPDAKRAMRLAVERLGLSPRGYVRVLRVARTIADLEAVEEVELPHLLEAIQYRSLDWGRL